MYLLRDSLEQLLTELPSFFMGIGSVIRTDADPKFHEMYMQAQRRPIIWRAHPAWRKSS